MTAVWTSVSPCSSLATLCVTRLLANLVLMLSTLSEPSSACSITGECGGERWNYGFTVYGEEQAKG